MQCCGIITLNGSSFVRYPVELTQHIERFSDSGLPRLLEVVCFVFNVYMNSVDMALCCFDACM